MEPRFNKHFVLSPRRSLNRGWIVCLKYVYFFHYHFYLWPVNILRAWRFFFPNIINHFNGCCNKQWSMVSNNCAIEVTLEKIVYHKYVCLQQALSVIRKGSLLYTAVFSGVCFLNQILNGSSKYHRIVYLGADCIIESISSMSLNYKFIKFLINAI